MSDIIKQLCAVDATLQHSMIGAAFEACMTVLEGILESAEEDV